MLQLAISTTTLDSDLVDRIRSEYHEMPGLSLTINQAARLWQLDSGICRLILDYLVRVGFLHRCGQSYVRSGRWH